MRWTPKIGQVAGVVLLTSAVEFPVLIWLTARQLNTRNITLYRPLLLPVVGAFSAGGVSFLIGQGFTGWTQLLWGLGGTFGGYLFVMVAVEYFFSAGYLAEVRRAWSMARSRIG